MRPGGASRIGYLAALTLAAITTVSLLASCDSDDTLSGTTTSSAPALTGDPCPFIAPDSTLMLGGRPVRDARLLMTASQGQPHQCELDTMSGTTEVGYGIALAETGIESPPPPTIPPDGSGTEKGSVTQVRSEGTPIYLVEFEFGRGTTRYLWAAQDGWSAIVSVADPDTPGELFDITDGTTVIDEVLARATNA